MRNLTLFKHFFENNQQLTTDERIDNFCQGAVMAIFLSIALSILSTVLIYYADVICDTGRSISKNEAKQIQAFTIFTTLVFYGLIGLIWIKLLMNFSNKDVFKD